MAHTSHQGHDHKHGSNCGHTAVKHDGHTDYLHDGHLHSAHDDHYDEHAVEVSSRNPADCKPASCSHQGKAEAIPHGDHTDHLHGGKLHHRHGDHCDDHGSVA
jgi:hypothetical protein